MLRSSLDPKNKRLFPVPELSGNLIFALFVSKVPPSCGVVSSTTLLNPLAGRDSKLGSAPLFARRNLPSLDPVPCGSLASVTASFAIFCEVTALSASLSVVTFAFKIFTVVTESDPRALVSTPPAVILSALIASSDMLALTTALSASLAAVTASSASLAVVTPPSAYAPVMYSIPFIAA